MIDAIRHLVAPLHARVVNMIARAVVKTVADDKKLQLLQLALLSDETKDDVERFQNYGFTSVPKDGAEAVAVFLGGKRDHPVVVAVEDRRYRIANLESGEVAVYNDTGAKIVMKKNGDIEVTPKSGQKLKISADVEVTGKLNVSAKATFSDDVDVSKTLTATTDVNGGGKSLKNHTHGSGSLSGSSGCTAGGASVTVSGSTGAPS